MLENKFKIKIFTYQEIDLMDFINCIYSGNLVKSRIIKHNKFGISVEKDEKQI